MYFLDSVGCFCIDFIGDVDFFKVKLQGVAYGAIEVSFAFEEAFELFEAAFGDGRIIDDWGFSYIH